MKRSWKSLVITAAMAIMCRAQFVEAQTFYWNDPNAGSWSPEAQWSPAGGPPNGIGVEAVFNGIATANNPTQTANHTVTMDGNFTIGRLVLNNDQPNATVTTSIRNTFNNTEISPGVFGTLTFDVASGDATIFVPQTFRPAPNETLPVVTINSILGPMVFNDNVVATVDNIGTVSFNGTLELRGPVSGTGGFTKLGAGLSNFNTEGGAGQPKTYTGPTLISGGRLRVDPASQPSMTSGLTINGTGRLEPAILSTDTSLSTGVYTFGLNAITLSGQGYTNTGLISTSRNATTGAIIDITNDVTLASDALIQAAAQQLGAVSGSITLSGNISGPGQLQLTSIFHDDRIGSYILTNDNAHLGGTLLRAGTLQVSGAAADLGPGDVTVLSGRYLADGVTETHSNASSRLVIDSGVLNAIADDATLTIGGQFTLAAAKSGFAELASGISETVGGLILGSTVQTMAGTYGSTTSGATFQNDEFFSGDGVINLVPAAVDDADFDNDGDVDGADFLTWQQGLGLSGGAATNAAGNANNDAIIDGADLTVWRNQADLPAVPAVGAVPEPGAALLALLAAPLGLLARRKRIA